MNGSKKPKKPNNERPRKKLVRQSESLKQEQESTEGLIISPNYSVTHLDSSGFITLPDTAQAVASINPACRLLNDCIDPFGLSSSIPSQATVFGITDVSRLTVKQPDNQLIVSGNYFGSPSQLFGSGKIGLTIQDPMTVFANGADRLVTSVRDVLNFPNQINSYITPIAEAGRATIGGVRSLINGVNAIAEGYNRFQATTELVTGNFVSGIDAIGRVTAPLVIDNSVKALNYPIFPVDAGVIFPPRPGIFFDDGLTAPVMERALPYPTFQPEKRYSQREVAEMLKEATNSAVERATAELKKLFLPERVTNKLAYEPRSSLLSFRGKDIEIPGQNRASLCRVLFQDSDSMRLVWQWDEMLEEWGHREFSKADWRKVHTAALGVNEMIARATTIADFLIVTTKTVVINPKYFE